MGEPLEAGNRLNPDGIPGVSKSRPPPTRLGLRRGTVVLAEYSPSWREAFREERVILANALASVPCQIEHFGSTAVPGLQAKPILDIAIGIEAPHPIEECIPAIEETGFVYRGEDADVGSHLFVRGSEDEVRTHYLHVVRLGESNWERWLAFRDYLRRSASARETYAVEKARLAMRYKNDREAYTAGKSKVIGGLLAKARGGS